MKYKIQVNIGAMGDNQWVDMSPSKGVTYVFDSKEIAEQTIRMCYPDHIGRTRIVPLNQEEKNKL